MRIAIVGTGYVGLVSGAGLANVGLDVVCVDLDENKVARLKNGEVPFYEPGLDELLKRNISANRLQFTTDISQALKQVSAVFLAVGTPMDNDGSADLSFLFKAAQDVAKAAEGPLVLVTKSTVPVGTADKIRAIIKEDSQHAIVVASNPEFLKEGDAVNDFLKPDRIVIGTDDPEAKKLLDQIYRPFMMREYRVIHMDTRSAELTKYAANAMLATRISFMNEMANLCEKVGANIDDIRKGISTDKRIGSSFLYPGVGYGGSCFPKDIRALIKTGEEFQSPMEIIQSVDEVNQKQRGLLLEKVITHFGGSLAGKTIAVWGIAFKPRTDDIREAPAIPFIEGILAAGGSVRAYDRAAMPNARRHFEDRILLAEDEYAAIDGADALALLTEWPEFRLPSWGDVKGRMASQVVFDGRNIYEPSELNNLGFTYYGIGRPNP
jgi:UDPglucose 6-dehydrogenase